MFLLFLVEVLVAGALAVFAVAVVVLADVY
jgi:hypothetical protein